MLLRSHKNCDFVIHPLGPPNGVAKRHETHNLGGGLPQQFFFRWTLVPGLGPSIFDSLGGDVEQFNAMYAP